MIINKLINNKNSQLYHSKEEIHFIVDSYTSGNITDAKMTDWLKAVYVNGMSFNETINYTNSIINSGEKIKFINKKGFFIDKHSTGGVGDKVSIILGPILAACGCFVPMIVGRALGHTGGTLDKLESIPNYNGLLKLTKFKKIVNQVGISIIGQTDEICPADKKIYSLRSKTETIKSFPLICGSIMGKKIAEGTEGLVLDIKTGNGAFIKTDEEALALGEFLTRIGKEYNLKVQFGITNMNQPLGTYSGLLCEIIESMETLKGNGPQDLVDVIYYLGDICLKMAKIESPKLKIDKVISDGSAYEILCKMIYEHGGVLEKIKFMPKEIEYVKSKKEGFISFMDTTQIGLSINALCYRKKGNRLITDDQAGCKILKKNGDHVEKNEVIAEIFCSNKSELELEKKIFKDSFKIKDKN